MSGLEQELGLSLGVLIDVVDEQWMRDTLPADDIPVPPAMAIKTEDAEDPAPSSTLTFSLPFTFCLAHSSLLRFVPIQTIAKRQLAETK
ncbi:hypothetical protein HU200_045952 [Digitaria exilis]|uniref:Anaphase-promoting complex subunit 13 n=1 Tax=Digitaria exilis TaxID=1010633 RepID=A0A835AZR7_9POAL|nr:hypothetical protein HU200_045952 [Digitaria exilis]CAB3458713.1 unnamed protein product [Digitaria exilis]